MALDDDDDLENEEETSKPKKKGRLLKILAIIFSITLLIGGSIGGTLYFTGAFSGSADEQAADTKAEKKKDKKKKGSKNDSRAQAMYYEITPAFVVNFIDKNQIRYLQVSVELMTREADLYTHIETHAPKIKNNIVMLLSNLTFDQISTAAGKQKLREQALAEVRAVLKQETGEPIVEELYFTSFVMQ